MCISGATLENYSHLVCRKPIVFASTDVALSSYDWTKLGNKKGGSQVYAPENKQFTGTMLLSILYQYNKL